MSSRPRQGHYALITVCALLVSLPLFTHGPSCGHDFDFHLQSWFAASAAWHGGASTLYPHWLPAANYGAGEPRFVFYPPLSWTMGALLGRVLPWTWVAQVLTLLAFAACGLAFYTLARAWVRPSVAAAAACVYLANPYLLFVAYERAAYGELLGAITMPLVLLCALRPKPPLGKLALVIAALWFTNAPAAVMGCYLVGLCALVTAGMSRSVRPALRSFAAVGLGTGVAGVYVLPAWYEQRWVEIARVIGPGMRVEDSFLFGHTGEPFHDQVLHTASLIAVAVLGAGFFFLIVSWAVRSPRPSAALDTGGDLASAPRAPAALLYAVLTFTLLAILLLLLPVSKPVWRIAPELQFLQFPWRWLLVGSLVATLAGATAAESLLLRLRNNASACSPHARRLRLLTVAMGVTLCAGAWYAGYGAQQHFAQPCDEEDNVTAQQTLLLPADEDGAALSKESATPVGFEGTDEYTPFGGDNGEIQQGLPAVRLLAAPEDDEGDDSKIQNPPWQPAPAAPGSVLIRAWEPEFKRLTITTPSARFAVLRLLDYPAWQVRLNEQTLATRPHREDGLLTIPVPAGTTRIEISYRAPADVFAGRALSLISLSALAGWAGWSRRLARRKRRA